MPELPSFEQQNKAEKPTLEEKLRQEYPELESRLTFTWPLNEKRRKAIEMLNSGILDSKTALELLESGDFVEQRAGLFLLKECSTITESSKKDFEKIQSIVEKIIEDDSEGWEIAPWAKIKMLVVTEGEKALPLLEKISENDTDWRLADAALGARIKMIIETNGENALPILEKIRRDNLHLREKLIPAIGNFGEKALPILKKMIKREVYSLADKMFVVEALGNIGEKALPILERLSEYKFCQYSVIQALGNIGEKSLPILERIIENEKDKNNIIRRAAIGAKIKIIIETRGEKALQILEQVSQEGDHFLKRTIKEELERLRWPEYQKILKSRKPLFATPHTEELAQRIIKISEAAKELQKKFKDRFIGLIVLGSTSKGYFNPNSDLDYGIIAKDGKVLEHFWEKADSLALCAEHYAKVNKENIVEGQIHILFDGLFFGDRQKLIELQETTLKSIDKEKWDKIRKDIAAEEVNLLKAKERFDLKDEELERIKQFALLLRVPPSREEALNAVRSQKDKNIH